MSEVFVLRNQHGEYLNKQREWLAAGDSKTLFRSKERDELINEKVELTVKSPELRIQIITAEQEQNGRITIDGEDCLPKASAEDQEELALETEDQPSSPETDAESAASPTLESP